MRFARPSSRRARELRRDLGVHQRLDLALDVVRELEAVRAEELDAVVLERVVRGRDHHAEIGPHRARQHGDGRRRHRAEQEHVHADRGEAGLQRRFDHVARQARILADHHPMPVVAALEQQSRRLADAKRQLRRDHAVGAAPDPVGAEVFARHVLARPHRSDDWHAVGSAQPYHPRQAIMHGRGSQCVSDSYSGPA